MSARNPIAAWLHSGPIPEPVRPDAPYARPQVDLWPRTRARRLRTAFTQRRCSAAPRCRCENTWLEGAHDLDNDVLIAMPCRKGHTFTFGLSSVRGVTYLACWLPHRDDPGEGA